MYALCRLSVRSLYRHSISRRRAISYNVRRKALKNGSTMAGFRVDLSLGNFGRTAIDSQTLSGRVTTEDREIVLFCNTKRTDPAAGRIGSAVPNAQVRNDDLGNRKTAGIEPAVFGHAINASDYAPPPSL
jgi:hypothetical protein